MAQLPRCVQQASWMRVLGKVGGGVTSVRGVWGSLRVRPAAAPVLGLGPRSQSLLSLCRSSSSSRRILKSAASSCERFCVDRPGVRVGPGNLADGFLVLGRGLGTTGLPSLSPFLVRGFSSAEASAVADGFLKESQLKDAEEKSGAAIPAAEKETEEAILTEVEENGGTSEILAAVEKSGASIAAAEKETEQAILTEVEEKGGSSLEILSAVEQESEKARDRDALVADIRCKELELEELRSALRLVDETESGPGCPEVEDSVEQSAALQVSAALQDSAQTLPNGTTSPLVEELASDSPSPAENAIFHKEAFSLGGGQIGDEELTSETSTGSEPIAHPWPEWTQFLRQLEGAGHFANEEGNVADLSGSTNEAVGLIKRACLIFSRERDDIFLNFSRKDLEVVARFGCPCTDRKVVNAGKRLRDYLAIDEISVCKPCALRSSCERADFKASADHVPGTPEVMRLLSQYALEVSPNANQRLQIPDAVQRSCINLLKESMALSAVPRDPKLPKVERNLEAAKNTRREREGKRRVRDADVEMKPGDWKCAECQYVNFARNRTCRECDAFRPVPEMRPGDWRCPECQFVNFSKNDACYDCKADKPAGVGFDSSYDRGSRYDRGSPRERGSRFDRGSSQDRRSEVQRYDRDSERGSYGRSDTLDYERGSDRGWSRDKGGFDRRSGGDDFRGGRRSNHEEWKPDLKKRGKIDDDLEADDDEDEDDDEFDDSDEEAISDVEAFDDEEFEDMMPATSSSKGRSDAGRGREVQSRNVGRSEDKDRWWEDDRSFRGERSERGSRGGRGRGGRGGGRGDFGRNSRSSDSRYDRDSGRSYGRSDRDSGRSYGNSDRDSGRSYGNSSRDSGRSYGNSGRDSGRSSRGRGGGGRGGGRGRGR